MANKPTLVMILDSGPETRFGLDSPEVFDINCDLKETRAVQPDQAMVIHQTGNFAVDQPLEHQPGTWVRIVGDHFLDLSPFFGVFYEAFQYVF